MSPGEDDSSVPPLPGASHRAKRSLGQNFLVDGNLQRKIVEAVEPAPLDEILEIGPGRGALTRHLLGRCRRLVLVELDDALASGWEERHRMDPGVEVIHGDILKVPLTRVTSQVASLKVVGNIPYNITAPILFHLLTPPRPALVVLMVQEEVADRILAPPGTPSYGALSIGVQGVAVVERVLRVPRTAFRPVPRVDSAVVAIRPHHPPRRSPGEEGEVRRLVRAAFQWRRKQLGTILRGHPELAWSEEELEELRERSGLDLRRRPETLSPDEFAWLALERGMAR